MIAAIYARKSTDQGAIADEAKSVTRQVDHAREYAERKGWHVDEAHIYVDDGISGAEFTNRPGFVRLMATLKPRPPFQVLIMSEESRLGREAIETAYALKQLVAAGVRVFFYLEDRERTLDSPTDKVLLSLTAFADELEREKTRQRVTDTMRRKARAGHVTGGRVFGYDNVEVLNAVGVRSHVERRINDEEAAVVRRIFELAAAGAGQARIAQTLNGAGSPAPRAQQGRPRAWVQSSVHEILFRPLYRGEIVYNRTRKRNRWGEKHVADRPAEDRITVPAPHLRIVPESLWQAAHARIEESRVHYEKATRGLRRGRPRDVDSKYLLPGLAVCARCNGGMHARSTHHGSGAAGRRRVFFYACTRHTVGACTNSLRIRMDAVDRAVFQSLGGLLTPDLIDPILTRLKARLTARGGPALERRERLETELAGIEGQIRNLTDAIALGGNLASLVDKLQKAERRRQELVQALTTLSAESPIVHVDWPRIEAQARRRLQEWRSLLTDQIPQGRQLLRLLLGGRRLRFTPLAGRRRGYRFEGEALIGTLFGEVVEVMKLASPPGFEPGFQP